MACDRPHNHRCSDCGRVWHHDPKMIPHNPEYYRQAHACPDCGRQEYALDGTGAVPEYCSNGLRCIKLDGSGEYIQPHKYLDESPDDLETRLLFSQISRLAEAISLNVNRHRQ